jgi:hypothetical protein
VPPVPLLEELDALDEPPAPPLDALLALDVEDEDDVLAAPPEPAIVVAAPPTPPPPFAHAAAPAISPSMLAIHRPRLMVFRPYVTCRHARLAPRVHRLWSRGAPRSSRIVMGTGPSGLADLAALPEDAHERTVAEGIVVHLQDRLARKSSRTPEEEEFIVTMQSTWKQARALGRDEGRTEGATSANARAVLTVLRVRGIAVPDAARERILVEKDPARLERWHERAILAASIAEVIDDLS